MSVVEKMKKPWKILLLISLAFIVTTLFVPAASLTANAAGVDDLSDKQKNSSYGFFIWLSENAKTADEKEDAKIAAQIISNTISSEYESKVFNDGHIFGGSHNITYANLLAATSIGAENDSTSIEMFKAAVGFISSGNKYRAKESLPALKISSALMAMGELNCNYQDINAVMDHSNVFYCMENLAYRQLSGTWKYGKFDGKSDNPYEGWYEEEKSNFDSNNGKQTGHYETLTDRQGKMLLTGFGVRDRYVEKSKTASDGKAYPCQMQERYYSQQFSSKDRMYDVGSGVTPDEYLAYLDQYQCAVLGHDYKEIANTAKKATCTEAGKKADQECSRCGEKKTGETIPAAGHEEEVIPAVAATCTETGLAEGKKCTVCGEVLTEQQIVKALGHDWGEWTLTTEPTDNEMGIETRSCKHDSQHKETRKITKRELTVNNANESIKEAANIKEGDYTAESYEAVKTAKEKLESLLIDESAENSTIESAINELETAIMNLKAKTKINEPENKAADQNENASDKTNIQGKVQIVKKANTMKVVAKTKKIKAKKLKKKAITVKAIIVKNAKGKVTYRKLSGSKKLKLNTKNGKIIVKKKTKKGAYKIKVRVMATGSAYYKAGSKTVTVKIKVK